MAEAEPTKVCPHCAETIKVAAKVCPHCRYWQKRWSLQNPQVGATLCAVIGFGMFIGLTVSIDRLIGPKEEFATYRDEISVVDSRLSHRIYESNLLNTVVGTITNRSNVTWKDVGVEAQFFDKSGRQIDAITVNANDYHSVVILPHGEASFKIEGKAARPESDYDTFKTTVRWAKDADAL